MRWRLTSLFSALYLNLVAIAALGLNGSCSRAQPAAPVAPPPAAERFSAEAIYGADNRRDLYRESNPALRRLADSTVLLVKTQDVNFDEKGGARLRLRTLADAKKVCGDEPFRDQVTAGFCSGFLATPDTVVTAGHCITDEKDCADTALVFGFSLSSPTTSLETLPRSEVYRCSRVLRAKVTESGPDYAVVQLDRPVLGHLPLKLGSTGEVAPGDEVLTVGHPMGLPTKIAGAAKIRAVTEGSHFTTNLDSYGGNSGSPVFRASTLEVEGILVRGATDMYLRHDELCFSSVRLPEDLGRGEAVTSISVVRPFLFRN